MDMSLDEISGAKRGRGGSKFAKAKAEAAKSTEMPPDVPHPLSREEVGDPGSVTSFRPERRGRQRSRGGRAKPYARSKADFLDEGSSARWERGAALNGGGGGDGGVGGASVSKVLSGSNKVLLTNLDTEVTEEDIEEIFQELGNLKSVSIKTDSQGRSQGVAEVVFPSRSAAAQAVAEYDGAEVDGKPMYLRAIEGPGLKVTKASSSVSAPRPTVTRAAPARGKASLFGSALNGAGGGGARRNTARGGGRGRTLSKRGGSGRTIGRGGGRGSGGRRGGGRGGGGASKVFSAADLDNEMDAYFKKDAGGAATGSILSAGQPSMTD